jgi:hypothetical protein
MPDGGFCTACGHRVVTFGDSTTCPECGREWRTAIPCADENQVTVSINWQELRVLVMWAENYQRRSLNERGPVYAIAKRIEAQHPGLAKQAPLTFAGELGQIADEYRLSTNDARLRRDVAEQTGHELGLHLPPEEEPDGA